MQNADIEDSADSAPPGLRRVLSAVHDGRWLRPGRARAYSLILIFFYVLACVAWIAFDKPLVSDRQVPFGSDFAAGYAASVLVLAGEPAAVYDVETHRETVQEIRPRHDPFSYPPTALLIVSPAALMPYELALAVMLVVTLAACLLVVRGTVGRSEAIVLALGFGGTFVNLVHGQNAFFMTALLGMALLALSRGWTIAAALSIALMLFKPQFGLLVPVALIAGAHWRALGATVAASLVLLAVTVLLFGVGTWEAFLAAAQGVTGGILSEGLAGWSTQQSVFSTVRFAGGDIAWAYAVQGTVALSAAVIIAWLWRGDHAFSIKAAALAAGTLLATPYVLDYDLMILAIVLAWLAHDGLARGFLPWEKTFCALVWFWPLVARAVAAGVGAQLTPFVLAVLLGLIVRRALWFQRDTT